MRLSDIPRKALKAARLLASPVHREAWVNNALKEFSYTHGLTRNLGRPMVFEIETTNQCPYTCVTCPRTFAMTREVGQMDFGLFRALVDQLRPAWQVESWKGPPLLRLLHFGEPFVYRKYAESIEHCHARGFQVFISTNPSVWTEARIEQTLETGLDELLVMMDGMDDETSMAIRGRVASFVRGEKNLLELAARKAARGLDRPRITVGMIKQPRNRHQWELFKTRWRGVAGIDAVYLAHYSTFGGDVPEINALEDRLAEEDPAQAAQVRRRRALASYPCYYPWHSVSVVWDGRVVPCCRDYDSRLVLGDLNKQTLEEVWNGAALQGLRREFKTGRLVSEVCRKCKEPSLEIGLPGRFYPLSAAVRGLGFGKMPGAAAPSRVTSTPRAGSGSSTSRDAS